MNRKIATEFDQELLNLYDRYAHNLISRREFLDHANRYAVGGITAAGLLSMLSPEYAWAAQVDAKDARIKAEYVEYQSPSGHGKVKAYLARPANATGKLPSVLVVHENRGLNPYIEDVARRLAVAGFLALAPDGLTSVGGYPGDDDKGRELQSKLDGAKLLADFEAGAGYLKTHASSSGKVGVVGFCYGGGVANQLAVRIPDPAASVPYYGGQPKAEDVPKIKAPLLIHYAELDERINAGWSAYEKALKDNNKKYTMHMYPKVNHGFHNDTTPRYDKDAAELSWKRTVDFFKANLA